MTVTRPLQQCILVYFCRLNDEGNVLLPNLLRSHKQHQQIRRRYDTDRLTHTLGPSIPQQQQLVLAQQGSTMPQQQQQHHPKEALLRAVDTFIYQVTKGESGRSKRIKAEVKFLEDLPVPDGGFYKVPHREVAGLGTTDSEIPDKSYEIHYLREEVKMLWREIDELPPEHNLVIQGQPGTGKSTAVWRKVLEMAANGGNVLWVSLQRSGQVKAAVYFQGRYFLKFVMLAGEIKTFIMSEEIPLDTVVLDGKSQEKRAVEVAGVIEEWVKLGNGRSISTASTKLKQERPHQNDDVTYHTVHSWTIEDFNGALLQEGQPTALFDTCANLFWEEYARDDDDDIPSNGGMETTQEISAGGEDFDVVVASTEEMEHDDEESAGSDDSNDVQPNPRKRLKRIPPEDILALIFGRYEFSGGSARWMFNYTKKTIESHLKESCNRLSNRQAIQNGLIGPTSDAATNVFFGSSRKEDGSTEYFLVSKRAVEILAEVTTVTLSPKFHRSSILRDVMRRVCAYPTH